MIQNYLARYICNYYIMPDILQFTIYHLSSHARKVVHCKVTYNFLIATYVRSLSNNILITILKQIYYLSSQYPYVRSYITICIYTVV